MVDFPFIDNLPNRCLKCESKTYNYSDKMGHKINLCWTCGAYNIQPAVKDKFTEALMYNPLLLLELIKDGKIFKI